MTRSFYRFLGPTSKWLAAAVTIMLCAMASLAVAQSPDPNSPRWKGVETLEAFFKSSGDKELDRFLKKKIAPALHKQYKGNALREELRRLRADLSGMELQGARSWIGHTAWPTARRRSSTARTTSTSTATRPCGASSRTR